MCSFAYDDCGGGDGGGGGGGEGSSSNLHNTHKL
jgi:hypothetical protein